MPMHSTTSARERLPERHDAGLGIAESAETLRDQIGQSAREVSDTAGQQAAKVSHIVRDWLGQQSEGVRERCSSPPPPARW
jgi:hypothetical protein